MGLRLDWSWQFQHHQSLYCKTIMMDCSIFNGVGGLGVSSGNEGVCWFSGQGIFSGLGRLWYLRLCIIIGNFSGSMVLGGLRLSSSIGGFCATCNMNDLSRTAIRVFSVYSKSGVFHVLWHVCLRRLSGHIEQSIMGDLGSSSSIHVLGGTVVWVALVNFAECVVLVYEQAWSRHTLML